LWLEWEIKDMAWSIIVTLEAPLPDATAAYAKAKPGKAVARESDRLDSAARRRSVATIT
jgi:hypothetical protein